MSMFFSIALGRSNSTADRMSCSRSTGASSIVTLPASIFEKSRMSLMIWSSESAEC